MQDLHKRVGAVQVRRPLAGDWWGEAERWRRLGLLEPGCGVCANNRANALWLHNDPWAALPEAERAVALLGDHPLAWRLLGNVLQDLGRLQESLAAYLRSLELAADPSTATNASKVLYGLGRFAQGYALAEQRLAGPDLVAYRPGPYWQGWPHSRNLWLWSEQGYGDVLQHLRWLVPLLQQGYAISLELESPLVRLVEEGLAWAGGSLRVLARQPTPDPLPPGCSQGSLLSLSSDTEN